MNHLAHAHLSGTDSPTLVGNLAADYLRKRECLDLSLPLQRGVELHRHIDHSTDNHPVVREAWALLRPRHGKYASVIFDIYGDYLLTRHWERLSGRPLRAVADDAYAALAEHADELPQVLAARFARMSASDWLLQYGSYDGLSYVFERFGRRLSKPELLRGVIDTLRQNETRFAEAFLQFYPWMQASCAAWLAATPTPRSED